MSSSNSVKTLILGLIIGLFGGFILGALFGKSVFQLASFLIELAKQQRTDEDRMKFELLLQ